MFKLERITDFVKFKNSGSNETRINLIYNMRFLILILGGVMTLLVLYYLTVIINLFTYMLGRKVDFYKTLIPFYGWTKWFKDLD